MLKKPGSFSAEVWNKLSVTEKKEIYFLDLLDNRSIPPYIVHSLEDSHAKIDDKLTILEKVLTKQDFTDKETAIIGTSRFTDLD